MLLEKENKENQKNNKLKKMEITKKKTFKKTMIMVQLKIKKSLMKNEW